MEHHHHTHTDLVHRKELYSLIAEQLCESWSVVGYITISYERDQSSVSVDSLKSVDMEVSAMTGCRLVLMPHTSIEPRMSVVHSHPSYDVVAHKGGSELRVSRPMEARGVRQDVMLLKKQTSLFK